MSNLSSIDSALQAIAEVGSNAERDEYARLTGSSNEKAQIPAFSHAICENAKQLDAGLRDLTKEALVDYYKIKFPTEQEISEMLKKIAKPSAKIIHYNPVKIRRVTSKYRDLIPEKSIDQFVICRKMFNFQAFSEFLEGIRMISKDFIEIIKFSSQSGFLLSIDDVSDFIDSKIPTFNTLKQLSEKAAPFYRQNILEQVSFDLDPLSTNKISPVSLITSSQFNQFLMLDSNPSVENSYSYAAFVQLYGLYSSLVNPETGLVNKQGLRQCGAWSFCEAFIDRVFETAQLFDECLDFGGFIHLYQCYQNSETPTGARYFFNLFDVDEDGLVGPYDISFFYKDLVKESGVDDTELDVFIQELLDKTGAVSFGFNLKQFIECGSCEEITSVLADVHEFKTYVGHDDDDNKKL